MINRLQAAKWIIPAWLLLVAIFLSITAYYIVFHHVAPLSRDQWHMYHMLFEQGLWRTSITTVSGHRHILAFLLYDIDLNFFNGNNHFLIAFDWLLNISLIALLCSQIRACISDKFSRLWLIGWTIVLLCWLLNIALLGWGFNGINNYMSILNTVLSIFFLYRAVHVTQHKTFHTIIAVLLGGLATLSFGNGILVWPIGLLSLYFWRAPLRFSSYFALGVLVFFALYLLLPGGGAVSETLRFNGWTIVSFPLELMGGPLYHLLRAWKILPEAALSPLATGFGVLVCLLAALALWQRLQQRLAIDKPVKTDALDALAITLILIGFGTTFLLTLTRVEGVLDPAVDRFQIWALLVWWGVSVLLYRAMTPSGQRGWQLLFLVFPLLALPAQLDWGARLAEYRTRVDNALLAYQVYLPVADDAEKALHWNWQNKLPDLFPVLKNLRTSHRNIFTNGAADWLGKTLPATADLPGCQWGLVKQEAIVANDLLNVAPIAGAEPYVVTATSAEQPLGQRFYANVGELEWSAGLIADSNGIVRGLMQPVRNSSLPRFKRLIDDGYNNNYNAYGITRLDQPVVQILLLKHDQPLCRVSL
jgi:hypothetical protein